MTGERQLMQEALLYGFSLGGSSSQSSVRSNGTST